MELVKHHEPKALAHKTRNKLHTGEWRWLIRSFVGTGAFYRDSLEPGEMLTDEAKELNNSQVAPTDPGYLNQKQNLLTKLTGLVIMADQTVDI